jgi:C4-dicarboxylate-specific signal transduction histidine kinase
MPVTRIHRKPTPARNATADAAQGYAWIDAVPWPCIVFDRHDGTALASNAAFRDEFPQFERAPAREHFDAAFESTSGQGGKPIYYAAQTRRWYRIDNGQPTVAAPAEALFITNISECIDLLRRHQAQHEQLLSTSRMMSVGEMATTLAHELNQPLAAAVNYLNGCEQLAGETQGSGHLLQGIRLAKRQAERAAQIIGSIREFVRSREPYRQNLDAHALVHGVIELLRLEAEQFQVAIVDALPADLPPIFADRVMIEQVLLNLIKNAIEAMRETPPARRGIRVTARVDYDGMVEIRVVDQGCGLGAADMQRLFTPLYTTKPDGLGIGLAICRSIVEYHEGRLFAEPNPEGRGGCAMAFTVPRGNAA